MTRLNEGLVLLSRFWDFHAGFLFGAAIAVPVTWSAVTALSLGQFVGWVATIVAAMITGFGILVGVALHQRGIEAPQEEAKQKFASVLHIEVALFKFDMFSNLELAMRVLLRDSQVGVVDAHSKKDVVDAFADALRRVSYLDERLLEISQLDSKVVKAFANFGVARNRFLRRISRYSSEMSDIESHFRSICKSAEFANFRAIKLAKQLQRVYAEFHIPEGPDLRDVRREYLIRRRLLPLKQRPG